MGWTGFPATQATDWSAKTFVEQFAKASNERRQLFGWQLFSLPQVGWDLQSASNSPGADTLSWYQLQQGLEQLVRYTHWVKSHDSGGNPLATDYYDGRAAIDRWTLANWREAAGLNASGFTRKYPDGMGGTATAYGLMQTSDYIGPWIFNELQAGLNLLIWTKATGGGSWNFGSSDPNERRGVGYEPDWVDAQNEAKTNFDANHQSDRWEAPNAWNHGQYNTGPNYYATLARTKNYLAGGQASTECKRTIDYYAFAVKYNDAFDAFGDDVLEDTWSLWASYTPDPPVLNLHSPIALGKDGVGDYPTPWCDQPTAADPNTGRGYSVTGFFIIIRWNISDGFEYVGT